MKPMPDRDAGRGGIDAALREDLGRIGAVIDCIPAAISMKDPDGRYLWVNRRFAEEYGLDPGRVPGRTDDDLFPPDLADRLRAGDREVLEAGRAIDRGELPTWAAGATPGRVRKCPIRDSDGSILAVCGVAFNAGEDRVERALRESERRIAAILESIADGFFALDAGWRFAYVNAQAEAMLGRARGELLGRVVWEEFPEAVDSAFDAHYHRAVAEGVPTAFEADYAPLGRRFSVHAYPLEGGLSVYFTDATERHRAELALRESERRFRLVMENSRDVIYQIDLASATYDYASPSSLHVLGCTPEEMAAGGLGRTASTLHPADQARLRGHLGRRPGPDPGREIEPVLEYRVRVPGKGWRWMSDSRALVRDAEGKPTSIVGTIRDVTDRREAEHRLRDLTLRLDRAQEEERGRIARELHDEIGSALTAIKLNLRGMSRSPDPSADGRRLAEAVALVERAIEQVREISLDLRPPILDDIGLVEALRSLVAGFARRTGLSAEFVAPLGLVPPAPDVETACYRIAQEALTNVARHAGARHVRVELTISASRLGLEVGDDGAGFDVEAMMARAAGGYSLGLLGMNERAALIGGRVEIRSGAGRGAVVLASLPMGGGRAGDGAGG